MALLSNTQLAFDQAVDKAHNCAVCKAKYQVPELTVNWWAKVKRHFNMRSVVMLGPVLMVLTTIAPFIFNISIFVLVSFLVCYFLGLRPDFVVVSTT